MEKPFNVSLMDGIIRVGFNAAKPATNAEINGAASLPATAAIVHSLCHVVDCCDPKLTKYVGVILHAPALVVGDLIT